MTWNQTAMDFVWCRQTCPITCPITSSPNWTQWRSNSLCARASSGHLWAFLRGGARMFSLTAGAFEPSTTGTHADQTGQYTTTKHEKQRTIMFIFFNGYFCCMNYEREQCKHSLVLDSFVVLQGRSWQCEVHVVPASPKNYQVANATAKRV